jgi:hypothetical protein
MTNVSIYEKYGVNTRSVLIPHCNLDILIKDTEWIRFVKTHIEMYRMYPTKMMNVIHQDGLYTNPKDMFLTRNLSDLFGRHSKSRTTFKNVIKVMYPELDILIEGTNDRRISYTKTRNTISRQDSRLTQDEGT